MAVQWDIPADNKASSAFEDGTNSFPWSGQKPWNSLSLLLLMPMCLLIAVMCLLRMFLAKGYLMKKKIFATQTTLLQILKSRVGRKSHIIHAPTVSQGAKGQDRIKLGDAFAMEWSEEEASRWVLINIKGISEVWGVTTKELSGDARYK